MKLRSIVTTTLPVLLLAVAAPTPADAAPQVCSYTINYYTATGSATHICRTGTGWLIPYAECSYQSGASRAIYRGTPRVKPSSNIPVYAPIACPFLKPKLLRTWSVRTNL